MLHCFNDQLNAMGPTLDQEIYLLQVGPPPPITMWVGREGIIVFEAWIRPTMLDVEPIY